MDLRDLRSEWPALSTLLDEALALPAGERGGWLAALAGERAALREVLARLLAEAPGIETDDLLAAPPRFGVPTEGAEAERPGAAAPGDAVGPYLLLCELGRGGMGSVWLAERADAQPRRRIALKLPHIGWAPGLAARLARERDILASLAHPNIARLYDAGVDRFDRPYLALEYVDGMPIDRYCEAHALPLRARLALVLQVAAAVGHAHTRLVVHRDLKPSNILVTEGGEVRLLDFGIAKLLQGDEAGDSTDLTRQSGRALTPDYASPEQIRGEPIGTPSDVYSLGVVAFELLAGVRPYRLKGSGGAGGLASAIANAATPPASRVAGDPASKRQLSGDLDAILNKALKKDPAERYATVAAFADDIERHLRDAPVSARPDRLGYRARKFVVRHALQVGAGALVLAALLVGSGVALWQGRQARFEAARAEQVKDFVLSMLADADTDSGAGAATTAADLLKAAKARVEGDLKTQPEVAVELMTAVAYGLLGQGLLGEALELVQKAVELAERTLGPHDRRTLAANVVYGEALLGVDRSKDAIQRLTPAIAEARRQHAAHELIDGLRLLALAERVEGDAEAGLASARAAVDALPVPTDRASRIDAANAWSALSVLLGQTGREGAADAARRSLALTREVYGDRVNQSVLSNRLLQAEGLAREGRTADALAEFDAVYVDTRRFLGATHPQTGYAANTLGNARLQAGDSTGAVDAFQVTLAVAEATKDSSEEALGIDHYALATALAAARRNDEALPHFDAAARLLRAASGEDAPLALRSLSARALALTRLGRLDEADRVFAALAPAPWAGTELAANAARLAVLRGRQGRHEEAVALARTAVAGLTRHPSAIARAAGASTLGTALLEAGRPDEAIAPLQEAVRLYAERQIAMSPDRADTIAALERARSASTAASAAPAKP